MTKLPKGSRLFFKGPEYAGNHYSESEVDILDVSEDTIFTLFDKGKAYWGKNINGATLSWVVLRNHAYKIVSDKLLISFHYKYGFQFFYVSQGDRPTYMLAMSNDNIKQGPVEMDFQTPFYFPSGSFHSIDVSKQISHVFIHSEGREFFNGVSWVVSDDDFSEPSSWEKYCVQE